MPTYLEMTDKEKEDIFYEFLQYCLKQENNKPLSNDTRVECWDNSPLSHFLDYKNISRFSMYSTELKEIIETYSLDAPTKIHDSPLIEILDYSGERTYAELKKIIMKHELKI